MAAKKQVTLPRRYYRLSRAVELLGNGCTVDDLIHLGACRAINICMFVRNIDIDASYLFPDYDDPELLDFNDYIHKRKTQAGMYGTIELYDTSVMEFTGLVPLLWSSVRDFHVTGRWDGPVEVVLSPQGDQQGRIIELNKIPDDLFITEKQFQAIRDGQFNLSRVDEVFAHPEQKGTRQDGKARCMLVAVAVCLGRTTGIASAAGELLRYLDEMKACGKLLDVKPPQEKTMREFLKDADALLER